VSILEGFKQFDFSEGVPYASVTQNGVTFNKSVVKKLGLPSKVVLLINEDNKQIAVQVRDENDEDAVQFYRPKKNNVISVRWNGRDLLNTLSEMMEWNLKQASYRIEGHLLKDEKAMLFDLKQAEVLK